MRREVPAIPPHIGKPRAFKARKRRELAVLERALLAVLTGSAYTPLLNVGVMLEEVRAWRRRCSAAEWGR